LVRDESAGGQGAATFLSPTTGCAGGAHTFGQAAVCRAPTGENLALRAPKNGDRNVAAP
jgi:hypothetical protein